MKRTVLVAPVAVLALALAGCGGKAASGSESAEDTATVFALSVQTWSPYLERWTVDGSQVTYAEVDCLGQEDVTEGTLADGTISWDGDNPQRGFGPTSTTTVEISDTELQVSGAREAAVTDVDGQTRAHIQKCKDAGETVGKVLLK